MPVTPVHCGIAYLARAVKPQLRLPALLVGSMVPDLEIPFLYVLTGGRCPRFVLHSLLGAVTLVTVLSVVLTVFVYPPVVSRVFKLDRETVRGRCCFSWSLVVVCLVGGLSHVLVDALHH